MSDTQQQATRSNRHGNPCPSWCVADHDAILVEETAGNPAITFDVHTGPVHYAAPWTSACAVQRTDGTVIVHAIVNGATASAPAGRNADELAAFIEALAGTPEVMVRQLADAVRQAARDAR
jgi:hypothetical protein